jgi:hypothetical protein
MNERDSSQDNHYEPGYPPDYPQQPLPAVRKKSRWLSGLLAFFVPGTGHLYLGLMLKGIAIMMLIALDISAIVFAATENYGPLVIVLLSLLMPIIYFYNLFDALQSTDTVNDRRMNPAGFAASYGYAAHEPEAVPPRAQHSLSASALLLLAAAGAVVVFTANFHWFHWPFRSAGSMVGAAALIGVGIVLWLWEARGQHGGKR